MRCGAAFIVVAAAGCSFTGPAAIDGAPGASDGPPAVDGPDAPPGTPDAPPPPPDAAVPLVCPPSYSLEFEGHRYRIASGTWYQGEQACEADGPGNHLVVLDSGEETAFAALITTGDIWIGMSDHRDDGTFRWVHNGAVTDTGTPPWDLFQPDDQGHDEDCGELTTLAAWNDANCEITQVYLCECDGVVLPTSPVWCVTDIDTACENCDDDCVDVGEVCQNHTCQ